MIRFLKGFGMVFILGIATIFANGMVGGMGQVAQQTSVMNAWVTGGMGMLLSAVLLWVYWYLYRQGKVTFGGLTSPFDKIWFPLGVYAFFLLWQIFFVKDSSSNQKNVIDFVTAFPIPAFLVVVLSGPILEEFVFRGFIATYLFPDLSTSKQTVSYLLISSTLFSLIHFPNTVQFFFVYFMMGLSFGWIYLSKKDIRYAMALHIFNNALSFIMILLSM